MQESGRKSPQASTVIVDSHHAGQRVDNFLLGQSPGVPRSHVYRIIRTGQVRVNSGRVKPTRKLREGDRVRIPPLHLDSKGPVRVPDALAAELVNAIVEEHEDFLIVNKPPGVAVHAGSGLAFGVIDALRQALEQPRLELVHRLDRATSGCLLIARNAGSNRALQNLFRERQVGKHYQALVAGQWPQTVGLVDAPLAKNVDHAGERQVRVSPDGQPARTLFQVSERFADATLLDVQLDTGRTHQIRVHTFSQGHAVVGDSRYGDNRINADFRRRGLARLFLHSRQLCFDWRGQAVDVSVPTDDRWNAALASLRHAATLTGQSGQ